MGNQTAKLAAMLGAQGAVVTWDAGGNEFIEVVRSIQACERLGIKTVFLTSEDDATDGAPDDARAAAGGGRHREHRASSRTRRSACRTRRPVERVIGLPYKMVSGDRRIGSGRGRDKQVATSESLPPPWRYDDHYGFGSLSCIE